MNIFKEEALKYFHKGINVIPDKFQSKMPAIKGWTEYGEKRVTKDDITGWSNAFDSTNIAVPLGSYNKICVLDVDTTDQKLIDFLDRNLPASPVERYGSKGFVRFFRTYPGCSNYMVKDALGNCVFEVLAQKKKITIAPSVHPSGMKYRLSLIHI